MLPSKPRSGLSDTSNNKTVPATPKAGKMGRAGCTKSDSGTLPLQKSRSSLRTVESKPAVERRAPKPNSTTPDKHSRAPKGSELQVQEDLKKAKEQLASAEQEKVQVVEELKDAKRLADETNEKLKEALAAQKRAEECSQIEKFRAYELEQASLESSKKKQEEWEKELDSIKKEHSLEVEILLSETRELEKVKDELEVTTKAKISALSQAEDAMKIAETNAEKVELLSGEISRLKSLLDTKLDSSNGDTAEMIKKLDAEINSLRFELERAKQTEEKVVIMESLVERLSTEVDNAKSAELDSLKLADEWKKKAELLEIQLTEASQSEKSLEAMTLVEKQLEECSALLQDSELEISALRQKIELLEDQLEEANQTEKSSLGSQVALEKQLEEVNAALQDAESEAAVLRGKVESLEIEVADVKKAEWDSAKLADALKKKAESLVVQLAEVNQFTESSSDSLASITKQLEDSNSSLQDVLSENAAFRVKVESLEVELAQCKEDLKDSEWHLDSAQQEAIEMGKAVEGLKCEIQSLEQALSTEKAAASDADSFSEERNKVLKELEIARQEEGKAKKAMEDLASALHEMSSEARETQERLFAKRVEHEDAHAQIEQLRLALRNTEENYEVMLDEARYEIVCLKKAIEKLETEAKESHAKWNPQDHNLGTVENGREIAMENGEEIVANCADKEAQAKAETLRLKKRLLDRENELHSIRQENAELRVQGTTSIKKMNEFSTLVLEAITKESGELSNSEKDYDLLPSSKEIPVESVNGSKEEKPKSGEDLKLKEENGNGHHYLGEEPVEVEVKMLEGYKANENDKDLSSEMEMENEEEAIDDDLDLNMGSGSFDNMNGLASDTTEEGQASPTKQQQQHQKKKKHLFKFGNLLKKRSPHK